ncbi:VWA domain-containing protein, partial [bacterium]|nr:VWA domain-containing protein [bacterium]
MKRFLVTSLSLLVYACLAFSQITIPILPDEPMRGNWSISSRDVSVVVRDQVASTSVTDELINHGKRMIEVEYLFPIPPGAAVDQMTLLVNGQELSAILLNADEARKTYNDIVRRKKDPALLEYADYGLLKSSAFPLEPNKPAKIIVHYDYVCGRDGNLTEIIYPLSTGKYSSRPLETLKFKADIESAADIVSIYSPTHDVKLDRKDSKRVVVTYEAEQARPKDDLVVFYSEESQDIGATLLTYWPERTKDGYYMMLVSPNPRTVSTAVSEKDIVIVMDKSGSMSGEKIEQAREAARFVISNLNDKDRFNLIYYDDHVETVFETLREVSEQNIEIAMDRIDRMGAGGSTNIHAALETAVGQCADAQKSASKTPTAVRPAIILFLTDGLPTTGNTRETDILSNTKLKNAAQARIFSFGVGYDVNIRLLDNLADENKGRSSYVQPAEDIEAKVSSLYNKIKNPVMTDVAVEIEAFKLANRCPVETGDLFEGDQL